MNAPSSTQTSTLSRAFRVALGVALTAFFALSMLIFGVDLGSSGVWWMLVALATSMWMLLAAVGNWHHVWTAMGQLLRVLLGERGARIAIGVLAVAFALGAMAGSVDTGTEVPLVASATATK